MCKNRDTVCMIRRGIYRAHCKWCMAEEQKQGSGAPGVYLYRGEFSSGWNQGVKNEKKGQTNT